MLRFSCNDPNKRYYLNKLWPIYNDPVSMIPGSIFFQRKVALYTGLLSPKGLRIKILIVAYSNCNAISTGPEHQSEYLQNV